jgi:NADH-quinone oxidoreductase subunit J
MNLLPILFYAIAALILAATTLAVTRRNLVYAVIYLVLSFFGTAMLFYLLGAPFLAALEIIIYAGAIMVLFLFIIMMIHLEKDPGAFLPRRQLIPATLISALFMMAFVILAGTDAGGWKPLAAAQAMPAAFGIYLFDTHWLSIEIASMLLLVALIAAIVLGRKVKHPARPESVERTP